MAEKDYYSFEEVLKNLKLEEDQLKRLVSAGEIRAFRDKNTMRFKAEDVDRLRSDAADDLVLDDELELGLEEPVATPAASPTAPRAEEELDLGGDELILEDPAEAGAGIEELDLGGATDDDEEAAPAGRDRARAASGAAAATRRATRTTEPAEEAHESVGMMAMLVVATIILVCANCVIFDAFVGRGSNPLSKAVANLF